MTQQTQIVTVPHGWRRVKSGHVKTGFGIYDPGTRRFVKAVRPYIGKSIGDPATTFQCVIRRNTRKKFLAHFGKK